jgi:nucleotide-binding universal stress UspA family protein
MSPGRKLLVGYDGSDSSRKALDRAAAFTGYGDQLLVVNVIPDQEGLTRSSRLLDEAESRLILQRVVCRTESLIGKPARELMNLAADTGADLIVVGTGKTALQRLFLGSVSTEVVHHAPCDVLVVR